MKTLNRNRLLFLSANQNQWLSRRVNGQDSRLELPVIQSHESCGLSTVTPLLMWVDFPPSSTQQIKFTRQFVYRALDTSWPTMACTIWISRKLVNTIPAKSKSSLEAQLARRWHQPISMLSLAKMITVAYSRIRHDVSKHDQKKNEYVSVTL